MDINDNEQLAKKGMRAAQAYLENKGYEIVDTDYRCPFGQIDVVSKFEDTLAFTSVSVYRNDSYTMPKEHIDANDRQRMEQVMAKYLSEHDYVDMSVRWDNMSILVVSDDKALLRYHVNALGGDDVSRPNAKHIFNKDKISDRAKNASKAPKKSTSDKSKNNSKSAKVKTSVKE